MAIGLLLFVGWRLEDAAVARLLPPRGAWFESGQIVTLPVTAGEPKSVYWDFQNARRGVRSTAECRAVDRKYKTEVILQKVGGDLRVNNWSALATMQPPRNGSVDLTCISTGASWSRFAVGESVPSPRPLNGVSNYSGAAAGWMLVGLAFLVPALIILALCPLKPAVRVWIFRFWAPLLIATLLVFTMSSVWNGFLFWLLWFVIGWFRRRKKTQRSGDQDTDAISSGSAEAPGSSS